VNSKPKGKRDEIDNTEAALQYHQDFQRFSGSICRLRPRRAAFGASSDAPYSRPPSGPTRNSVAQRVPGGVQIRLQSDRQCGESGERIARGEDARLGQVVARPQVQQPAGVAPLAGEAIRRGSAALAGKQAAIGIEGRILKGSICPTKCLINLSNYFREF
jgi:hypothetical protein